MSPPSLTVYPNLPPTTNSLNSQQRTRLMRSTRKLGAVLGTTPCLLENDTSFAMLPFGKTTSRVLKRQGSIFTHRQISSLSVASSSTSITSSHQPSPSASSIVLPQNELLLRKPPGLSTSRKQRSGDKVPQLYLRLDTTPSSPSDERIPSPLSPSTPPTPTPITPVVPDAAEIRRKRMAKLTHHLGENIPVELVFTAESDPKPPTTSLSRPPRKRSQSVHVMSTQAARIGDDRPSAGLSRQELSRQEWVGEWNRTDITDVQNQLRKLKVG